jgi:hypothetical protein
MTTQSNTSNPNPASEYFHFERLGTVKVTDFLSLNLPLEYYHNGANVVKLVGRTIVHAELPCSFSVICASCNPYKHIKKHRESFTKVCILPRVQMLVCSCARELFTQNAELLQRAISIRQAQQKTRGPQ